MPQLSRQRLHELESTVRELRASLEALKAERADSAGAALSAAKKEVSPLLVPLIAGILTLVGGIITGVFAIVSSSSQARENLRVEELRQTESRRLAAEKQQQDHDLETDKLRSSLVLKLTEITDATQRKEALLFYARLDFLGPGMEKKIMAIDASKIPQSPNNYAVEKTYKSGTLGRVDGGVVVKCGLVIDTDGAPTAYHPPGLKGLAPLGEAGRPGNWYGLLTDEKGNPVVQGPSDPAPGYYISPTTLQDESKARTDPRRYVDSAAIPYVVIPADMHGQPGDAQIGDVAVVYCETTGKLVYAVIADYGPKTRIGEGSVALANQLGLSANAMAGGIDHGVTMILFPKSGHPWPMTVDEINQAAKAQFERWGGEKKLKSLESSKSVSQSSGDE